MQLVDAFFKQMQAHMGYNANESPGEPQAVLCPHCGSANTELLSLFGQQLLTVQFYCNHCHTPFECIKDDHIVEHYVTRRENTSDNTNREDAG
jgi:hypothetical protein